MSEAIKQHDEDVNRIEAAARAGNIRGVQGAIVDSFESLMALRDNADYPTFLHDLHTEIGRARSALGDLGPEIDALLERFPNE